MVQWHCDGHIRLPYLIGQSGHGFSICYQHIRAEVGSVDPHGELRSKALPDIHSFTPIRLAAQSPHPPP